MIKKQLSGSFSYFLATKQFKITDNPINPERFLMIFVVMCSFLYK